MRREAAPLPPSAVSGVVIVDAVLLYLVLVTRIFPFGDYTEGQALGAAIAGGFAGALLGLGDHRPFVRWGVWPLLGALGWAIAAVAAERMLSGELLFRDSFPVWRLRPGTIPGHLGGLILYGGEAVAGGVAGFALAVPGLSCGASPVLRRVAWSVGLVAMAAIAWATIFHGDWVA